MDLEVWFPFVLATILVLVIPGPVIILVVSKAVNHGRKSVVPLITGVLLGDFTAMTVSFLGLGAILSASAVLFFIFKWIGVFYLTYLGIKMWRSNSHNESIPYDAKNISAGSFFKNSYIVTATNPKGIAFFVAFLPQFVQPQHPVIMQLILLGGTFLFLSAINISLYALFAGQLGETVKKKHIKKWFNRCGGSALIGAGIVTAGMQKSS